MIILEDLFETGYLMVGFQPCALNSAIIVKSLSLAIKLCYRRFIGVCFKFNIFICEICMSLGLQR